MRNFFSGTKFRITVSILLSLLLGVFFAAVSDNGSSPVSTVLSFVTAPLSEAAKQLTELTEDFNGYFRSSKAYADQIDELREENARLTSLLVDYEKTLHKLEAYEEFLEVKEENPDFSFVPAQIILKDTADIYGSFTLNQGSADGVRINDPVIYGDALVGTVRALTENSCTVYSLFNPAVSVSAYEIRTREDCYTESELSFSRNGLIILSGLTKNTPVVSGGVVATSGIGGLYPKDLVIGTVRDIKTDETGLNLYALVEPQADYSLLTDVFIVTDFEGKNG
ncbi:MAG: rod shape-determining protein MreC [Clostridia bacterium]|nr:rod shape-determining protein MreC [Clostridia bacterium]